MEGEVIFFYAVSALALGFAGINGLFMVTRRGRTARTTATVVSFTTVCPERVKRGNGKWAQVSYKVGSKVYTPTQRIQVPMSAVIGSKVTVRYDRITPQKLYSFSGKRIMTGAVIGIICLVLGIGRSIYY